MKARGCRHLLVFLVSVLLSWPLPALAGTDVDHCDTVEAERALAAAQRQAAALQVANQALSSANQALTADAERLRAQLRAVQATVDSFAARLFGQPADGNVAAVARAAALAELTAARARAPRDQRLRIARRSFEQGERALRRQETGRAIHEFRETHEMATRIRGASTPTAAAD